VPAVLWENSTRLERWLARDRLVFPTATASVCPIWYTWQIHPAVDAAAPRSAPGPEMPHLSPPASVPLTLSLAAARRLLSPAAPADLRAASAAPASPRARTRTRRRPPLPVLSPELVQQVFVALSGAPLDGAITTDGFRRALPLALTCRAYYAAFVGMVRALDVLPAGFASPRSGTGRGSRPVCVFPARESSRMGMPRFGGRPRRSKITDTMVRDMVAALPNLVCLHLSTAVNLTDAGAMVLAEFCPQLRRLKINGSHTVTDLAVRALSSLRGLETLDLSFCTLLTDASGGFLANYSALTELHVKQWTSITDGFVRDLFANRASQGLVELSLSGCSNLSDSSLTAIVAAIGEHLQVLRINRCRRISDAGIALLAAQCVNLQELDIGYNDTLTSEGVGLLENMPKLQALRATNVPNTTDAAVARLATAGLLTVVELSWCPLLSDASAEALANCQGLQDVNLNGVKLLTDVGVGALAALPALETLKLMYCVEVGDESARALAGAANAPLNEIDVRRCRRISAKELDLLRESCLQLHDSGSGTEPSS
jgi:Leucine Rich repeat